jgi:hypothetical protein
MTTKLCDSLGKVVVFKPRPAKDSQIVDTYTSKFGAIKTLCEAITRWR